MQCVLWLTEFKSITRVQCRIRTEWNVVTGLPTKLIRTPAKCSVFYHEKDTCQFEISKFSSPLKFCAIGG
ncbi:hypothetical protein TNCV_337811 [Trichonephila clavipes]|nr:hypothetical protein TNCV_337811 [Trichonephila clavipes]